MNLSELPARELRVGVCAPARGRHLLPAPEFDTLWPSSQPWLCPAPYCPVPGQVKSPVPQARPWNTELMALPSQAVKTKCSLTCRLWKDTSCVQLGQC